MEEKNLSYLIIINNAIVSEYEEYYFKKYPRRKVFPIEKSIVPSLNSWMQLHHQKQNHLKQAWKDFIVWVVHSYNLQDKHIELAKITYTYYFPTKIRHDADNYNSKFANDGLVASGLLVDDDFEHISVKYVGRYDHSNPRMEILIEAVNELKNG